MRTRQQEYTNRAKQALAVAAKQPPGDLETSITDLMADLMHLAEANDLDFGSMLDTAELDFVSERPDPGELSECEGDADLPMYEDEDLNLKRANRGAKVVILGGYCDHGLEWRSAIADALTDLQHLAGRESVDFDVALNTSRVNFEIELEEDAL